MKVAVVGTGGIAQAHLRALSAEPNVTIAGHVSRTPAHAEAAARRWGGGAYPTLNALLAATDIDAVWITTPPHTHGALELDLVSHGIPFFVEKPLAADRETPERIAQAVATQNLITAVGYNWRAMDTLAEVRDVLAANPPSLVLGAWHDTTPPPAWWHRQTSSGGQMVEQATHVVDLARYLVGEATLVCAVGTHRPRAAYPELDVDTVSAALLSFSSGAQGVFSATCLLHGPCDVSLTLICDGLRVTITREFVRYESGEGCREVGLGNDSVQTEDRAFLEAVRLGEPPRVFSTYHDALKTHHLTFDILEASLKRQDNVRDQQVGN